MCPTEARDVYTPSDPDDLQSSVQQEQTHLDLLCMPMSWRVGFPGWLYLCKSEELVRYKLQASTVDFSGPLMILCLQLLEEGVINPQVNVPLPIPLLVCWGNIADSPFVHVPYLQHMPAVSRGLEQSWTHGHRS